jgi:hypothetical protein
MLDPADRERFTDLARTSLAAGATVDDVIAELRRQGLHKIYCIPILHFATGMPLGDAKKLVHFSPAWADRREATNASQRSSGAPGSSGASSTAERSTNRPTGPPTAAPANNGPPGN